MGTQAIFYGNDRLPYWWSPIIKDGPSFTHQKLFKPMPIVSKITKMGYQDINDLKNKAWEAVGKETWGDGLKMRFLKIDILKLYWQWQISNS